MSPVRPNVWTRPNAAAHHAAHVSRPTTGQPAHVGTLTKTPSHYQALARALRVLFLKTTTLQGSPRIFSYSHRRGPRRLSAHRCGIDRHWAATPTNWGPRNPSKGLMLTYGPTRNNGQRFGDRRRSRATSPRRRATYGGDDNVPVNHGAKGAVEVAGEHQRHT